MQQPMHFDPNHPDARLLGAYYDLWFEKVRQRARTVGYSASDRYNETVKQRLLRREIETRLTPPQAAWLDYGCGPAHLFKELGATSERPRVGVDISSAIIAENRERFADLPRTAFHTLDDGYLRDLPSGAFDCITCIEVIEHIYGVDEVVASFSRWLKPGGTLLITTPNARRVAPMLRQILPERAALYLEDRVEHRSIDELEHADDDLARFRVKTHVREFTAPDLKALLCRHGLQVESTAMLALKVLPNRTFNALAARIPGFVGAMERLDAATRHWPIGFFKTCMLMVARLRP